MYDKKGTVCGDGVTEQRNFTTMVSMAMLAASAIMGFGHDLIEDQKTEDDLRDMVQEEVRKQLSEKNL